MFPIHLNLEVFDRATTLYYHHVIIPNEVVAKFDALPSKRRVLCTINDEITIHASLIPNGKGEFFIMFNKKIRDKLFIREGCFVDVTLAPDESEYGMPMPDEFRACLNQDPEGEKVFEELTPGKQRSLIYVVSKVKSPNLKMRKAIVIVTHLATHKNLDFKVLNAEMKQANKLGL
jgi:hypothetical protein